VGIVHFWEDFRSSKLILFEFRASNFEFWPRLRPLVLVALFASAPGCHRHPEAAAPLLQRGYLWQREWTPAVIAGFHQAESRMDGVVVLGSEVSWSGNASHVARANIPWTDLQAANVSIAIRMAPFDGPFAEDTGPVQTIASEAKRLLADAQSHGVRPAEVQLDFDCAQKKLAGYTLWVRAIRRLVAPLPLVITTLPSWLDEPDFPLLVRETAGYVLQVHSVPTLAGSGRAVLCDTALARNWVGKASRIGIPFSVSLPAYWCVAGYDEAGKLIGVAMDSVQPAWPPGTSMLDFSANEDDLADLVAEWQHDRPPGLKELLWYRVPVATDQRNWRWPTLAAVMQGRKPSHRMDIIADGGNPVDLSIANNGEAEEHTHCAVTLTWDGARPIASDALTGWNLTIGQNRALFSTAAGDALRLSPGDRRSIGWVRYDKVTVPRWQLEERQSAPH
jgi:hypothetical protein